MVENPVKLVNCTSNNKLEFHQATGGVYFKATIDENPDVPLKNVSEGFYCEERNIILLPVDTSDFESTGIAVFDSVFEVRISEKPSSFEHRQINFSVCRNIKCPHYEEEESAIILFLNLHFVARRKDDNLHLTNTPSETS